MSIFWPQIDVAKLIETDWVIPPLHCFTDGPINPILILVAEERKGECQKILQQRRSIFFNLSLKEEKKNKIFVIWEINVCSI